MNIITTDEVFTIDAGAAERAAAINATYQRIHEWKPRFLRTTLRPFQPKRRG